MTELLTPEGERVRADVCRYTRGGTDSPYLSIYYYKGRQLTPYIMRREGWSITLSGLFIETYGDKLEMLIPVDNPLFRMLTEEYNKWEGAMYHQPVVLGLEHGVSFTDEEITC